MLLSSETLDRTCLSIQVVIDWRSHSQIRSTFGHKNGKKETPRNLDRTSDLSMTYNNYSRTLFQLSYSGMSPKTEEQPCGLDSVGEELLIAVYITCPRQMPITAKARTARPLFTSSLIEKCDYYIFYLFIFILLLIRSACFSLLRCAELLYWLQRGNYFNSVEKSWV